METLEDIYIGSIETDRGTREQVRFYDTRGLRDGLEFPRHYFSFADGFVLVYSIDSKESFKRMEALKKDIDRYRDKKEVRTFINFNGSCEAQSRVGELNNSADFRTKRILLMNGRPDERQTADRQPPLFFVNFLMVLRVESPPHVNSQQVMYYAWRHSLWCVLS